MKTSIDKAAGGGWVVTVSKVLPCQYERSGVRTHLLERCFDTKAQAEEFERAAKAIGVVDGGFGGLFLTSDAHKCEHKGCSAWLGNDYVDLLIHELGHHYESSHLSEKYHKAITKMAGKVAVLALTKPEVFTSK